MSGKHLVETDNDEKLIAAAWISFWSEQIQIQKKAYAGGDRVALFAAIRLCANYDQVLPEWVAQGFINGYDKILNCRCDSWDEAFGRPFPKGANLNALRKRRVLSIKVANEVRAAADRGESITEALFAKLGKKLNISGPSVRDLYYGPAKRFRLQRKVNPKT